MKHIYILMFIALTSCATTEIKNSTNINAVVTFAEDGNKEAMHNACYRFRYGINTPKSYKSALYWCNKAAVANISSAQTLLAELYENGYGTSVDYKKAIYWYTKAAENNHPHAMLMLFFMYAQGQGVTQNAEIAYMYLEKAADLSHEKAINVLRDINEDSSVKVQHGVRS